MLKTRGAPSKTSKRGPHLFKNILSGTAPNTPVDDDVDGVKVMANEYDPSKDLEALVRGNIPSSPMRGDANSTNTPAHSTKARTSTEEEKKESEQDNVITTAAAGVDVVNKTLALFDDICAVSSKPVRNPSSSNICGAVSNSKNIKKEDFRHSWGQEPSLDEDETVTNPSLPSESTPYSSAYTSNTSVVNRDNKPKPRGIIPQSPSQDHENFEVVLDPNSLQSDDEDDESNPTYFSSKGTFLLAKQRRWLFSGNEKEKGTAASNEAAKGAAGPPPIAEEEMTEATFDPLVPDVTIAITDEGQHKKEAEFEVEGKPKGHSVKETSAMKKVEPKKSIVKRSWKSCKKLIAKAGGGGPNAIKEVKQQHHRAEVDNEAQHARSLEMQQELENNLQPDDEPPLEEKIEDVEETTPESAQDDGLQVLSSTTDVWNSIVASIAGTFDPKVDSAPTSTAPADEPTAESRANDDEKSLTQDEAPVDNEGGEKPNARSGPDSKRKSKPKRNASGGLHLLKSIKKSAKNLVLPVKKESTTNKPVASHHKPSAFPNNSGPSLVKIQGETQLEKPKAEWKAVTDKDTGKTYYYHRVTRETTWTKPKEFEQYEMDMKKWQAAKAQQKQAEPDVAPDKVLPTEEGANREISEENRPNSPRVASWPSTDLTSDGNSKAKESGELRRVVTPPVRPENNVISTISDSMTATKDSKLEEVSKNESTDKNWEKRNEVERLLKSLPPDNCGASVDTLMEDYAGREDVLLKELRAKVEALPLDETQPFDEPLSMEARKRSLRSNPPRSPHRLNQRSMTYMSRASATTRSSALTDRTEKIKNTGKGKRYPFVPITETLSSATSLSSRNEDDHYVGGGPVSPAARVPSRVPVPRERQLMVEELTDARISAESYEGNGGKRGRIVRGRERAPVSTHQLDTVYDGDNDTEEDNTTYDNDTYGTDSVSALSENETDFFHRKDNFEQARRRALDDAIEREDWDLAAALSEGMRAANLPGGYARAHSSWNQSELDKFIANNDWTAVKSYIARMRKKSQITTNKNIGAKSQLQHKDLLSESSWTSDSQSSYESYDSESEI
ncbi:WW domain containing protein [Nitzschia inconspicua]|uniref:WW domain containing protein n=1 Tax=Nitzschia inconspicua TaxID=303405 RepID=A0A9K3PM28_9STRA|nr:WW domain containing protein [Nitzschia inconspicua]